MIEYANIPQMIEYQKRGIWPLNKYSKDGKTTFKNKIEDIIRILLNKGHIKSNYINNYVKVPTQVFRTGTRGWEYPWVMEILKNNLNNNSKILDCGCGISGFPLELNRNSFNAYGLDYFIGKKHKRKRYGLSDKYIKKHSTQVKFINGGIEKILLEDNLVDAVTCISVMEHVVIDHKEDKNFHLNGLLEMKRVLKPGGLLICTYDTILDKEVLYANKYGWGENGWYYKEDIEFLLLKGMKLFKEAPIPTREDILKAQDAFFISPDIYFAYGYGSGFEKFGAYHRLTSVGFVLQKV